LRGRGKEESKANQVGGTQSPIQNRDSDSEKEKGFSPRRQTPGHQGLEKKRNRQREGQPGGKMPVANYKRRHWTIKTRGDTRAQKKKHGKD